MTAIQRQTSTEPSLNGVAKQSDCVMGKPLVWQIADKSQLRSNPIWQKNTDFFMDLDRALNAEAHINFKSKELHKQSGGRS